MSAPIHYIIVRSKTDETQNLRQYFSSKLLAVRAASHLIDEGFFVEVHTDGYTVYDDAQTAVADAMSWARVRTVGSEVGAIENIGSVVA